MNVYEFEAQDIQGNPVNLSQYKGKVLLIVNTASQCGFTPQYEGLQKLYEKYAGQGLVVLGFPSNQFGGQEPGSNAEITQFCQTNYGVDFPLFAKADVRGPDKLPLFAHLIHQAPFQGYDTSDPGAEKMAGYLQKKGMLEGDEIKWNFTKFLVNRQGDVVQRYESTVPPERLEKDIEAALAS